MTTTPDLRQLRYFVVLAERLHFSRAAKDLGIAQPALSQQIALLEASLRTKLFERRPRVELTATGRVFLEEARQVLRRLDDALSTVSRHATGEVGSLAIGYAASAVLTHFPEIIRRFRARLPSVTLHLRELNPRDETEAVRGQTVDVAFVREMTTTDDLHFDTIIVESLVALINRSHPLRSKRRINLRSLRDEPFVHFPREVAPALYDQVIIACRGAGFHPRVVQEVREWLTAISLVQAGVGVALVPESLQKLRPAGVAFRQLIGDQPQAAIALCYRRSESSPLVASFVETARQVVGRERSRRSR